MPREIRVVTGSFIEPSDAQHAVERLVAAGIRRDALSVLASSPDRGPLELEGAPRRHGAPEPEGGAPQPNRVAESACAGGTIGGTLGAVVAGVAAIGSIELPEIGVVLAGSIVAALAGAGAGGAAGGLGGALVGLGIGEGERRRTRRREAQVVVAVETVRDRVRVVAEILRAEGSREIAIG